jgi:hypothetical protein
LRSYQGNRKPVDKSSPFKPRPNCIDLNSDPIDIGYMQLIKGISNICWLSNGDMIVTNGSDNYEIG